MGFWDELYNELTLGHQAKEVLTAFYRKELSQAEIEQKEIAREHQNRVFMRHGQKTAAIHPKFYHYWGQRLGYECWDDKQFFKEFLRDNEDCRVKSRSMKTQVGWGAAARFLDRKRAAEQPMVPVGASKKKYAKNYGSF